MIDSFLHGEACLPRKACEGVWLICVALIVQDLLIPVHMPRNFLGGRECTSAMECMNAAGMHDALMASNVSRPCLTFMGMSF